MHVEHPIAYSTVVYRPMVLRPKIQGGDLRVPERRRPRLGGRERSVWSRRAIYHQGEGLRACGGHLAYPPSPMASAPACVVGPAAMVLLLLQSTSAFLIAPSTFHARRAHVLQPQQFRSPPLAMRTLEWRIFGVEVPVAETAEQQPNCEPHSILL